MTYSFSSETGLSNTEKRLTKRSFAKGDKSLLLTLQEKVEQILILSQIRIKDLLT